MAIKKITFSKPFYPKDISLKSEKQFFKLIGILKENHEVINLQHVKIKLTGINDIPIEGPITIVSSEIKRIHNKEYIPIDFQTQNKINNQIQLSIEQIPEQINAITFLYDIENINIPITDPLKDFENYINEPTNSRILFSAAFGQGKTTFLKLFFDQKEDTYETFHIYPINYSVSRNEDIFKFIKAELLFQLLGRDINFDKEKIPYTITLAKYLGENAHKIFIPFIKLIPLIGKDAFDIIENLNHLKNEFFKDHDNAQIDDETSAKRYISEIYEQEGSIFEDNFYTQLIRQLIEQLQEKGKQTILIIDDLDRMDPEHIFRILNVLSAHTDDYSNSSNFSNKFGFNKTIIVGDYKNLISIFKHRFGNKTDYRGYFDKFFSKNIFYYNNTDAVQNIIDEYTLHNNTNRNKNRGAKILRLILRILTKTNTISLRELLQLISSGNQEFSRQYFELTPFVPFIILNKCFTLEEIENKLSEAKTRFDEKSTSEIYYDHYTWMILTNLSTTKEIEGINKKTLTFRNNEYSFTIKNDYDDEAKVDTSSILINGSKPQSTASFFTGKDFADAIHMLFKKYKEKQPIIMLELTRYNN